MKVKLTKTGLDLFGFGLDRQIINVNLDRAYRLMAGDYANKDKPFMTLYDVNHSRLEPSKVKEKTIKAKSKKEKAVSKKAAKREKAVKP